VAEAEGGESILSCSIGALGITFAGRGGAVGVGVGSSVSAGLGLSTTTSSAGKAPCPTTSIGTKELVNTAPISRTTSEKLSNLTCIDIAPTQDNRALPRGPDLEKFENGTKRSVEGLSLLLLRIEAE
jgi:hypothetical protein